MQAVAAVLQTGRLHRYNVDDGEESEAARLEREYAAWQGTDYCLACTSGGYALQLALRAGRIAGWRYGAGPMPGHWHLCPAQFTPSGGQPVFCGNR